jgi:RimJ/RimL family protein N-acetyltransferase
VILETERLVLREAEPGDADFILELLNAPGFVRGIGDRGVRTREAAQAYIAERMATSYAQNGFGMWIVTPKAEVEPVGLAGLVRRDVLPHVDLGYAFLERAWGRGYAVEVAAGVLDCARNRFGLKTLAAIVNPDNAASRRVLEKTGFSFIDERQLPGFEGPSAYYEV